MTRILFFGLGHLSRGDTSIAADVARLLPRPRFQIAFLTTEEMVSPLRDMGIPAVGLTAGSPEGNLALVDGYVKSFRPHLLAAADPFTLNYSQGWSGLSVRILKERYGLPVAGFDQYDWRAANYVVDFYGGRRVAFPRLLEQCDLVIRNCPLNRPAAPEPGIVTARLAGGGPKDGGRRRISRPDLAVGNSDQPVVFIANSKWEYVNVNRDFVDPDSLPQLVDAVPHIVHSHLAALDRPLRIVHVGPAPWGFPVADHITYRHLTKLPPASFYEQMVNADLFLTTNAASVTLSQAVLAGVPALALENHERINVRDEGPGWLRAAAPNLATAHPFKVCPWGWYDFLTPVLTDNLYADCYGRAPIFDRPTTLSVLADLLDGSGRVALYERQMAYRDQLVALPSAADALDLGVISR